ncbi:NAD(P)-dependent oxidoreductase [Microbacterium rhizomatis]|uniref:NAD(P)-dependent oxidoreductase n=1 Tax=Microbacterium rhizomatis TaxID=1631477 RepID=A0A5J5J1H2_9MICO|nr:NAD(P)-dependent oxidoreductase [Microbacterium rhizomatis]KAA9108325.1 NAD(P)-dependent oxidoreductase [Microbacterium rhizomatis]
MHIAVVGLGEAGSIYAADLAARGATVTGTDPRVDAGPEGVVVRPDIAAAVRGAALVLSLVGADAAASVFAEAAPAMPAGGVFADMNTNSPEAKRRLAAEAAERGIPFVDVAILAPVPRARIDTPLLLSGTGAHRLTLLLNEVGIGATVVDGEAGAAAQLKLLRSVFMKGLAAVVYESAEAADAVGARQWVLDQIAAELGTGGDEVVRHLLEGTAKHAVRRETEMREVRTMLVALGARHSVTDGTIEWMRVLAERSGHAAG